MRGYRQFTEEDVQKVARLHAEGLRKTDIMLSTQLPLHVIYYIMDKRLMIPKSRRKQRARISREKKLDDSTINRIIVLTNFGYHCKEIAEDQQLPEPLVKQVIETAMEKKLIEKKC